MWAFEVEYLTGRVFAATYHDRRTVEWPPHPAKLFSALVAAYEECDMGGEARAALEWLEALPDPPGIYAQPPDHSGLVRDVHEVFVPVNDSNQLPERRIRRGRYFPTFAPSDPIVWYIWHEDPDGHAAVLQRIAENVTYLGDSMSPVRVRVSYSPPEPTLVPDPAGTFRLRTPGKGRLKHLEEVHELRKKNTIRQPSVGRMTSYRSVSKNPEPLPTSIFRSAYVYRLMKGTDFPTENVAKLVGTVRKAILDLYPEPIPEVISGHDQLSEPLKKPHIAITPLLDAGHRYADGHVMGFALWLPQDVSLDVILSLETALAKLDSLKMGRLGRWDVQYVPPGTTIRTRGLRSDTYTRDHDIWGSVTPVIFGKYPKRTQIGPGKDGGKVFAELCERVGLPRPNEVRLGSVSAFNGVPKASEFIPPEKFATRLRSHVWLRFDTPVHGPVLIGAGQFVGFGFCRPWGLS